MIRLEHVSKSWPRPGGGRRWILRDLTMTIPRGRNLALLGRNGVGKSTLLQLIAGTIRADSGTIHRECSVSFPLGFGGVFHNALTGIQNIRFVARMYGVDPEWLVHFVDGFSELGPALRQRVGLYSHGMRARLAFGISIALRFDVYLVDEITAVGDAAFRRKCQEAFMHRMQEADVIMVSHAMETIRGFCDSALVLDDGMVSYFSDVEAAIDWHKAQMSQGETAA